MDSSLTPEPVPAAYLEDESGFTGHGEGLFRPATAQQAAFVLAEAARTRTPVTVSGAGTGVVGGRVAEGGWVLSTERFRRLEIGSGSARVGAGVLLHDLQLTAKTSDQFYAPDPTEWGASMGGTIATNASGSRSFRYGSTRRWVEGLRVVLADGRIMDVSRGDAIDFDPGTVPLPAVTKNTAGYPLRPGMEWVDLFAGSEGTLGVVTEARLRLLPVPQALMGGVVFFADDERAMDAVEAWRPVEGLRMLEYLDAPSLELLRPKYPEVPAAARAALLIEQELSGEDDPAVDAWLERIDQAGAFAEESWFALSAADRERFRKFRHALPELVNETVRRSGALKMNSDYAVPVARNREMLDYYRQRLEAEFPGRYVIFGHIGDAHVHVNLLSEATDPGRAAQLLLEFARHAVGLGGTISAEHGLGKRKAHLLEIQYTEQELEAMRAVKRRLDPGNILGRGTLWAL